MTQARYSHMDGLAGLGFLVNAMETRGGGDGDTGCGFPRSDAEDMSKGARFIPSAVTLARRDGKKVEFVTKCGPCCWFWLMPDGTRVFHFDPTTYQEIGKANKRTPSTGQYGAMNFEDGAGPCPICGNVHTNGGEVKP